MQIQYFTNACLYIVCRYPAKCSLNSTVSYTTDYVRRQLSVSTSLGRALTGGVTGCRTLNAAWRREPDEFPRLSIIRCLRSIRSPMPRVSYPAAARSGGVLRRRGHEARRCNRRASKRRYHQINMRSPRIRVDAYIFLNGFVSDVTLALYLPVIRPVTSGRDIL